MTLRLSSACSNQLSYTPRRESRAEGRMSKVGALARTRSKNEAFDFRLSTFDWILEVRGLEPLTYSLQSYRSTN